MKKPLLYKNPKYFKLFKKFRNLYLRIKSMLHDGSYFLLADRFKKSLFQKFKLLYERLNKMQLNLGIKTAGIATAFLFISNIVDAQTEMPKVWVENEKGTDIFNSGIMHDDYTIAKFVDIDNDGDEDLFLAGLDNNSGKYSFRFFENQGYGEEEMFIEESEADTLLPFTGSSSNPPFFDFMDVDGDNDLDAFIINHAVSAKVEYYENIGTVSSPEFEPGDNCDNPFYNILFNASIVFEDLDGDDDLDAVLPYDGAVNYYENDAGIFTHTTGSDNPFNSVYLYYYSVLDFEDIDGDGDIDAIVGDQCYGTRFLENISTTDLAYFAFSCNNPIEFQYGYNHHPSFADLDEDDDMDLIVSDYRRENINLQYYENGVDTFIFQGAPPKVQIPIVLEYGQASLFLDLDDDGDLDLYIDNKYYNGADRFYENIGNKENPKFRARNLSGFGLPENLHYTRESFIDIDNDGDYDMFVANYYAYYGDYTEYYKNIGTPENSNFELQDQSNNPLNGIYAGDYINALAMADMDEDGDYDVIYNTYISGSGSMTFVYENTGTVEEASFVQASFSDNPFENIYYPYHMVFEDMDNDEDLDLLIEECGGFSYFENIDEAKSDIYFIERTGELNPLDTMGNADSNWGFGRLFDEDEIALILQDRSSPVKGKDFKPGIKGNKGKNFKAPVPDELEVKYYNYKDLLSIDDKTILMDENTTEETLIETLAAEYYGDGTLTYTLDDDGVSVPFSVTADELSTASGSSFDFETLDDPSYEFKIKVNDGTYTDSASYIVTIVNINDNAPVFNDQIVSLDENPSVDDIVATFNATDADELGDLTYSITAGNTDDAFEISGNTVVVKTAGVIDYETLSQTTYSLTVEASDGTLTDDATITVNINNINDNTPVFNDQTVSLDENPSVDDIVATFNATDADNLGALTYSIVDGNTGNVFEISNDDIIVSAAELIDYETLPQDHYTLTVQASDGTNTDDAQLTVNINNLNDNAPVLDDQTVNIDESPANGSLVATLNATDADNLGTLTYSITAGNTDEAFEISTNTVIVKTGSVIDYETVTNHQFILTVQVSDGELTDDAAITVNINNPTGIEDILKNELLFYPNPAKDELNLVIGSELKEEIDIKIVNSIGNIVRSEKFNNQNEFRLDVSNLSSGIYFLQVNVGEETVTKKIIIK